MDCEQQTPHLNELLSQHGLSDVLKALKHAVSQANQLPNKSQLRVLRATSKPIRKKAKSLSKRLMSTIRQISSHYVVTVRQSDSDASSVDSFASLAPAESIFEQSVEITDEALDHFNISLDDARGIQNANVAIAGPLGPTEARNLGLTRTGRKQLSCLDMEKPQIHFPDYPIDNSDAPFVPPYQSTPPPERNMDNLPRSEGVVQHYLQNLYKSNSSANRNGRHPYEDEISGSVQRMSERSFEPSEITVYSDVDKTPFTFINTEEQLFAAAERLKSATEVAIDIENHSVRSFQGFICLIQLSTRKEDFIIDALRLRGCIHRALAPLFSDGSTVKVLHGADRDVQWLERDFGIYVVNMFDTGQAARILKLPSAALSYLLTRFCSLNTGEKKKFQLADWRVRPLPDAMLAYARSDTHYLLYIYDRLRCELSKASMLANAWERSALVCRKRHLKIRYDAGMARQLAARHGLGLDPHQLRLLEELCRWRDEIAREEDESLMYVAPLNVLFGIVRAREKARTLEGLFKYGFPGGVVLPIIRNHATEVVQLICDALDAKLEDEDAPPVKIGEVELKPESVIKTKADCELVASQKLVSVSKPEKNKDDGGQAPSTLPSGLPIQAEAPCKTTRVSMRELTGASVSKLRKSSFLGTDSESSSEDEGEDGSGENGVVKKQACSYEMSELKWEGRAVEVDDACDLQGPNVETVSDTDGSAEVTETEEVPEKNELQLDVVSRVQEELTHSIRASIQPREPSLFEDNDEVPKEAQQESILPSKTEEDVEEVAIVSLLDAYRNSGGNTRKRKRDKPKQKAKSISEPFDYEQARLDDAKIATQKADTYDPLAKLKKNQKEDKKSRVKKRRRGSGRSMTFKGAPSSRR